MKDRVIVHRRDKLGTPLEGCFDPSVRARGIMERSIALNEGNVGEALSNGIGGPVGRAVIYDEDADIEAGPIDTRQAS